MGTMPIEMVPSGATPMAIGLGSAAMTTVAHLFASVGLVMVVLLTNHPHLAHLMGPFVSGGSSLGFGFGFEHRLLRMTGVVFG